MFIRAVVHNTQDLLLPVFKRGVCGFSPFTPSNPLPLWGQRQRRHSIIVGLDGIYLPMQLIDRLLVEVALLLIGLIQIWVWPSKKRSGIPLYPPISNQSSPSSPLLALPPRTPCTPFGLWKRDGGGYLWSLQPTPPILSPKISPSNLSISNHVPSSFPTPLLLEPFNLCIAPNQSVSPPCQGQAQWLNPLEIN